MATTNQKNIAVFLDRDGTIIYDRNYLSSPKQVKLYKYSASCIKKLQTAGFKVIIVTNQSGIARKLFTLEDFKKVSDKLDELLLLQGVKVDDLFYCPHIDEDNCDCRKPNIGMVLKAAKKHNIDLTKSYIVGDSVRDYVMAKKSGGKGILVLTGHGKKQQKKIDENYRPFAVVKSLEQATRLILKDFKNR